MRDGLLVGAKADKRGPLDFLDSFLAMGDEGGRGDDSSNSCRRGEHTESGDKERRFLGRGPAGDSAEDRLGDIDS